MKNVAEKEAKLLAKLLKPPTKKSEEKEAEAKP